MSKKGREGNHATNAHADADAFNGISNYATNAQASNVAANADDDVVASNPVRSNGYGRGCAHYEDESNGIPDDKYKELGIPVVCESANNAAAHGYVDKMLARSYGASKDKSGDAKADETKNAEASMSEASMSKRTI